MSKLKVMYEGILDLANCEIPCYVLEDGTRVLSGRQMQTALKLTDDIQSSQSTGSRLQRYLNQKSLHPYLNKLKGCDNLFKTYSRNSYTYKSCQHHLLRRQHKKPLFLLPYY